MPRGGEKFGAWWDEASAQAATDFFPRHLRHTEAEWAGRPFELAHWQRDRIIRPVFGWKRADGTRLIRIVWIEIPRKNGKTELAAGISLVALLADGERMGQVYSLAVDKNQARIVFDKAGVMVALSPTLRRHVEVFKTSIYCAELMAAFKPLSKGGAGKHGFSPSASIGDEVHEWTDEGELADVVHKGTGARRQPLEVFTTTAGLKNGGYAWDMHELALQILAGEVIDPSFLAVIFAAPEDADWQSEETHRRANPNFDVSIKADFLRAEVDKAKRSPRAENDFKRFHLNVWTEQITRWLPMPAWDLCAVEDGEPNRWARLPALLAGRKCYGGLDLASTRDIAALCWAFPPEKQGDLWSFIWRYWLPKQTIADQPLARRMRLESFVEQGAMTATDGNVIDYGFIERQVLEDCEAFDVQKVGFDPWNATQVSVNLQGAGVAMEKFGQGYRSMAAPSKELERLVIGGLLDHGRHPVSRWMAQNAAIQLDPAGNIKPDRAKTADKIDGIVAQIVALGISAATEAEPPSIYEDAEKRPGGLLIL